MARPADIRYTATHEWARVEGDTAVIGITDFAVEHLSDLVLISLPEVNSTVEAGQRFGEIESVKTVAELNSPVSGTVIEVNTALVGNLKPLSDSPFEDGWMVKVRLSRPGEVEKLLGLEAYEEQVRKEEAA